MLVGCWFLLVRTHTVGSFMSPSMNRRDSAAAAAAAQTNEQTAPATPNQVGGAGAGAGAGGGGGSGGSFGNRESEVRVVPIRTVIAAVPASSGNRSTSDHTSRGPMGIMYPVLARVQHMGSGNLVVTRPQGSDQPAAAANSVDLGGGNGSSGGQSLPETLIQQENIGIPGVDINSSAFGEVNMTDSQGISSHIQNRIQQFLGTLFAGENVQVVGGDSSGSDRQGNMDSNLSGNLPSAQNADNYPATTTTTRAGSASVEGAFLSNLLREIMPIISENREAADSSNTISPSSETTTTTNNNNNNNGNRHDSAQDQENVDRGTSSSRSSSRNDPPSSEQQPNPKRQRRN